MPIEELREAVDSRMEFARNMALYEAAPPLDHEAVESVENTVSEFEEILAAYKEKPIWRNQLVNQVKDVLSSDAAGADAGRLIILPEIPWPTFPWPPIYLMGSRIIDGDEVGYIPQHLSERVFGADAGEDGDGARGDYRAIRIFPAIIAGLALGSALGTIAKKLRSRSSDEDATNDLFAVNYLKSVGIDVAQSSTMLRPDYVRINEVMSPVLDEKLADADTASNFDALIADMDPGGDRAVVTGLVFVACVGIGFAAAYL